MVRRPSVQDRRRGERAFTVLEVLIALSLFGVVLVTGFVVFNTGFRGYLSGRDLSDQQANARLVLEWMGRRMVMAGLGTSPWTAAFTEADRGSVAFVADIDGDGTAETYRYCFDAAEGVVRELASIAAACSTGAPITSRGIRPLRVVELEFRYYNWGDVELVPRPLNAANRADVRRVRIRLGLDSNRSGVYEEASDLTLVVDTRLRNRQ